MPGLWSLGVAAATLYVRSNTHPLEICPFLYGNLLYPAPGSAGEKDEDIPADGGGQKASHPTKSERASGEDHGGGQEGAIQQRWVVSYCA